MKMILLPRWLETQIRSKGLRMDKALEDIDLLASILSPDDVAFYLYLNRHAHNYIPREVVDSFTFPVAPLIERHTENWDELRKGRHAAILSCLERYGYDQQPTPPGLAFFGEALATVEDEHNTVAFRADMLTYDAVVLRPVSVQQQEVANDSMYKLYNRLNALLSSRMTFEALATVPIFQSWLRQARLV